jgi:hypothetical protein
MTVKEFDEFVERQQGGGVNGDQVDWGHERDAWLTQLDVLYGIIESLLSQYTSSGQISIKYKFIDLNEEDIGSYRARQMILRIGRQEVDLVPAGTRFIGFKGYVEVIGSAGKSSLVLANKERHSTLPHVTIHIPAVGPKTRQLIKTRNESQSESELVASSGKIEWVWRILARPPERQLIELTRESFFQLLMEVTNG